MHNCNSKDIKKKDYFFQFIWYVFSSFFRSNILCPKSILFFYFYQNYFMNFFIFLSLNIPWVISDRMSWIMHWETLTFILTILFSIKSYFILINNKISNFRLQKFTLIYGTLRRVLTEKTSEIYEKITDVTYTLLCLLSIN